MTGSKGIYGGIAGWSECVHDWPIWCWVLRELVTDPCFACYKFVFVSVIIILCVESFNELENNQLNILYLM